MKLNKLLERQIRKLGADQLKQNETFWELINAINNSYNAFERDRELAERAFSIAEEEYKELNEKLINEVSLKKDAIQKLIDVASEIGEGFEAEGNEEKDQISIAAYLKKQIIQQKEIKQKLRDQKRFYEQILNEMPADIAVFDNKHRYLFVNPLGIKEETVRQWILGKTDEQYCVYRGKDLSIAAGRRKLFEDTVNAGTQKEWEERIIKNDGTVEYFLRKMYPVFKDSGELDIVIGYGINITERKEIEEQVRLSEARYKSIFDHSLALICTHDLDGKIIEVNKSAVTVLGYQREELIGGYLFDLLPTERMHEFKESYLSTIMENGKAEGIMVARSKSGKRNYILYQNFLVTDDTKDPYVIGFSQDITARIEAEKALKKSEEKYRNIIANMNLGMLEVSTDETIIYANNSFCQMSGYDQDELVGRHAPSLFLKNETLYKDNKVWERRQLGTSDAYELQVKNKRGEARWWLISGAPSFDERGEFKGSIGIHLDITPQKELEQELRQAKSAAEESAHAKEIFLANMSHEIRTPMNAILGIGRILAKTNIDARQGFYLDTIQNAANNLLVIINDLLDFSKIEAGKVSLEYIAFDLEKLLKNAILVLRHKAEEKGLLLSYSIARGIAPILVGDPYRLNQILMNLLSNALKFTETGTVDISCELFSKSRDTQEIRFVVRDTGIGMSEEFLNNLFEKFLQEDETVTRKFGGTGLGMSISKQLIELMGGSIQVHSTKNVGTTISFVLTLPVGAKEDIPQKNQLISDTNILEGKKILLVEDNEMNRLVANTVLSQYGASMTEAVDGSMALAMLKSQQFDLILMDVQMPVMDGLECTQKIRNELKLSTSVIALTANAFQKERDKCIAAGMDDFIPKPFEEERLVQVVAQWLGKEAATMFAPVGLAASTKKHYDLNKLKAISRGNDKFVIKMLELFLAEIPANLQKMTVALEQSNWEAIGAIAHKMKPSLHNMGIHAITNEVKFLESIRDSGTTVNALEVSKSIETVTRILEETVTLIREKELDIAD